MRSRAAACEFLTAVLHNCTSQVHIPPPSGTDLSPYERTLRLYTEGRRNHLLGNAPRPTDPGSRLVIATRRARTGGASGVWRSRPRARPDRERNGVVVMAPRHFPPGFLWGTATSAHQVEGQN